MQLAAQIIALAVLVITWIIERKRQDPEKPQPKWMLNLLRERQIKRNQAIRDKDSKALSKERQDVKNNIKALLNDEKPKD